MMKFSKTLLVVLGVVASLAFVGVMIYVVIQINQLHAVAIANRSAGFATPRNWTLIGAGLGFSGGLLLGIGLAQVVPTQWGVGFAGVLALLGVGCSLASSPLRRVSAGVAGMAAVAAFALPFKLNIVVAIAAAVALCLVLEQLPGLATRWAGRPE